MGTSTQYTVVTGSGSELLVFVQNASDSSDIADRGQQVWLSWRPEHSLALASSPRRAPARNLPSAGTTVVSA
jgi:spermidine/putrescine transport system ATP-binding protein